MKKIVYLLIMVMWLFGENVQAQSQYSKKILPYIDFIEQCNTSPVDYIMGLFEKYDVVILGERNHRDTTQYDLIEQLMSDPRFIEKVGHVMTEIGCNNQTTRGNKIVAPDVPNDSIFEKEAMQLIRDLDYAIFWEKSNFYQYLNSIYRINKDLPINQKIHLTFTDVQWAWTQTQTMDHAQYNEIDKYWDDFRDVIMAENAIQSLYSIFEQPSRNKALIIYNKPHCYQNYDHRGWTDKAAQYIFARFPERVANVMINTCKRDRHEDIIPIQQGKWDAAFAACGNKSIGFDLADSPFGLDDFDHYVKPKKKTLYSDIFTGFIFYKPVEEWVSAMGYSNFVVDDFEDEFKRRLAIAEGRSADAAENKKFINTESIEFIYREEGTKGKFRKAVNRYLNK